MAISFNELGNMGHLGNQMFQYAALRGIAKNCGYEWSVPPPYIFGNKYPLISSMYDVFELPSIQVINTISLDPVFQVNEKHFHFDEDIFNNCPDNSNINGYFQSYKYFENVQKEMREDFIIKNAKYVDEDYICVHVRRGDYVNHPLHHPVCDIDYYKKAMEVFPKENFLIISDDLNWCRQQDIFKNCYIPENSSVKEDMLRMINSKSVITANSSFSWWGAWLNRNENKKIVAPNKWFGVAYNHYNIEDLYPKEWIRL